MVDSKIKNATVSAAKKNITATNVRIEDNQFLDDEGAIATRVKEALPEGTCTFTIKISVELPDEEDSDEE